MDLSFLTMALDDRHIPMMGSRCDLTGKWVLDLHQSQPLDPFLRAVGIGETARDAARKLVLTVVIEQSETHIKMVRYSKIGTDSKLLKFGDSNSVEGMRGRMFKMTATCSPSAVVFVSDMAGGMGTLTDTRTLENGGNTMHALLEMDYRGGQRIVIHRFYHRA